jgi:rubredoxin
MTIELSDRACPECGSRLQVIYVTELEQVVSGWACPDCGFLRSEKQGFEDSVPTPEHKEYVLRVEKPLTSDDVRDPLGDVEGEFRARASAAMGEDEVWLLIDPDRETLVDIRVGSDVEDGDDDDADTD